MKLIKKYLIVFLCLLNGCSSHNTLEEKTTVSFEPTSEKASIPSQMPQYNEYNETIHDYQFKLVSSSNEFDKINKIVEESIEQANEMITLWEKQLNNLVVEEANVIDQKLFDIFANIYLILNQNNMLSYHGLTLDILNTMILDPNDHSLLIFNPFDFQSFNCFKQPLIHALIQENIHNESFNSLISYQDNYAVAYQKANYKYYSYEINNAIRFKFNEPLTLKTIHMHTNDIESITLISKNGYLIEILSSLLSNITIDQLNLLIEPFNNTDNQIDTILSLPIDTSLAINPKYSNDTHHYYWKKHLDYQIEPIF